MNPIVMVSYDYPPLEGGISRLCAAVVAALAGAGYPISVIATDWVRADGFPAPAVSTTRVPVQRPLREFRTWRLLRALPRDTLIVTDVWHPEATLALLAGHRRLVVLAHGNELLPGTGGLLNTIKTRLRRAVLGRAQRVICNSRYTEGLVKNVAPRVRTCVINPAVDSERMSPADGQAAARQRLALPADQRLVLSVSRLDAYKGHDVALRALALLTPEHRRGIRYLVAGRGSHQPHLQREAERLGVADRVNWLGFVADDQLPDLYRAADLFVLCTREDPQLKAVEGFGMVFLEAQAAGTPVVGTRAGGIPDAIREGAGGWLIGPDDAEALAGHFRRLLAHPEDFRRQGQRARARVLEQCTWEHYQRHLLRELESLA